MPRKENLTLMTKMLLHLTRFGIQVGASGHSRQNSTSTKP